MIIQLSESQHELLHREMDKQNKREDMMLKIVRYFLIIFTTLIILFGSLITKILVILFDLVIMFVDKKCAEVKNLIRQNKEIHFQNKTYLVDKRNDYELFTETSTHTDSDGDKHIRVSYKVSLLTELGETRAIISKQLYIKNKLNKDYLYFVWVDEKQSEKPTSLYDEQIKDVRSPYMVLGNLDEEF